MKKEVLFDCVPSIITTCSSCTGITCVLILTVVYGINTGFGKFAQKVISDEKLGYVWLLDQVVDKSTPLKIRF